MKKLALAICTAALAFNVSAQERVSIGTGNTEGVFYILGAGIANVIDNKVPDVFATAQPTGASIENLARLNNGSIQFGFSSGSTAYQAYHGEEPFKNKFDIVDIGYLYPAWLQIAVRADGPYKKIEDLRGAKISVGAPGSNNAVLCNRVFEAYGIAAEIKQDRSTLSESSDAIQDKQLDGMCALTGLPTPALMQLGNVLPIRVLNIDTEIISGMQEKYPYLTTESIPANTYKGQAEEVQTIGDPVNFVTSTKVPDELVYEVTKAIYNSQPELEKVHKIAKYINAKEGADKAVIKLHPGAQKFFDEIADK